MKNPVKMLTAFLVVLCCWFYSLTALAVNVSSLYSVELPVASQSAELRDQLIPQALKMVLVKVSGNSHIVENPNIVSAIGNVYRYVGEYNYRSAPEVSDSSLILKVTFAQKAIDSLLLKAGQPIWSNDRPLTLLWLTIKKAGSIQLLGSDSVDPAIKILKKNTNLTGLPFLLPIMDLTDQGLVTPNDVWVPFIATVLHASERYSPDATLIARLDISDPNNIKGSWLLITKYGQNAWNNDGKDLEKVIQSGVSFVADTLAKQYSTPIQDATGEHQIVLTVTDLQGIADYAAAMQYLRGLSGVKSVEVLNVSSSQAKFSITFNGGVESLKRVIALDSKLQQINVTALTQNELQYRLNSKEQGSRTED